VIPARPWQANSMRAVKAGDWAQRSQRPANCQAREGPHVADDGKRDANNEDQDEQCARRGRPDYHSEDKGYNEIEEAKSENMTHL
jgi:hypothetical protein